MYIQAFLDWLRHVELVQPDSPHKDANEPASPGQGLVEYALLLAMIAIAAIALMVALGPGIGNMYQNIIDQILSIM